MGEGGAGSAPNLNLGPQNYFRGAGADLSCQIGKFMPSSKIFFVNRL